MGCFVSTPVGEAQQDGNVRKEMKKEMMDSLTAEGKADALLAIIPGRMFSNGSSNKACVFTQQGRKGTNQDAMVVWEGYASMEDTVFCGVFDGHGPYGHLVARRVRDSIPSKLVHYWQEQLPNQENHNQPRISENMDSQESMSTGNGTEKETTEMSTEQGNGDRVHREGTESWSPDCQGAQGEHGLPKDHPPMFEKWKESFLTAYRVMDKELRMHPGIDCFCSGTTAVTVLKQGKHLVIGNVGDSRAILGTKDEKGAYHAIQLTVDLKPNLPREAERIKQCRGRVFALHDEPEVPRVWLPFDDSPGLAMARAFGDFCLKDYGVIAVPEMSYRHLTEQDQFIVLATDGIWDVLSNDEVVQVVAQAPTRATAARALVESAVRVWRLKYPTSKVDDCAVVCLYVDQTYSATEHILKLNDISPTLVPGQREKHDGHLRPENSVTTEILGTDQRVINGSARQDPQTSGGGEISTNGEASEIKKSKPPRKLADWLGADEEEEEEWSALEGVTRVNSLLNLPRFHSGDKRSGETSSQQKSSS